MLNRKGRKPKSTLELTRKTNSFHYMRNECSSLKLIQAKLQRLSAYLQVCVLYGIVYVHSLLFPSLITMFGTFPCVLIHSVITSIQHDLKPATTKA